MNRLLPCHHSRSFLLCFLSIVGVAFFNTAQAQIHIQFPASRMIFQRDPANRSSFAVSGTCPPAADRLEVRLIPVKPGQGNAIDWQLLDAGPEQGQFNGLVTAPGGWYQLEVRAIQQGSILATATLDRVGVGEVFLISGQSNARGLMGLGAVAATDDRINCINYENAQNDTTRLPLPPVFSQMTAETSISPTGQSAWCWGRLGDLLAARLNVPILFYNTASSGTTIRNWRESAEGNPTRYTFGDPLPPGMPYKQFRRALVDYVAQTGVRAVLWHQGEAEAYDTTKGQSLPAYPTNYVRNLNWLIGRSRQETNLNMSWVIARASIDNSLAQLIGSSHYQPVIDSQDQTVQTTPNTFAGPATDNIQFPRTPEGSGVHFTGTGLTDLAAAWNASLTDAFFATSTPVTPPNLQLVDLQLSVRVDRRIASLNQPLTFSVTVDNTGTNAASQVKITNTLPPNLTFLGSPAFVNNGGTLLATVPAIGAGQSVVLTYQASPAAAGVYQNAAEIIGCRSLDVDSHPGSDVADGEDDEGSADFRTIDAGSDVFRTPVRSSTPPSPSPLSNQSPLSPDLADLSLRLVAGELVATVGQPWSMTLIVDNQGGATAQNVQIGCTLPDNMTFRSSPNMSLAAGKIQGVLTTIPAGGTGLLWFTASPVTAADAVICRAQIEAAAPADPDSTPNNGFTNGEDDAAQCQIRVR